MLSFLHGLGKRSYNKPTTKVGSDSGESVPSRNTTRNASDSFSNDLSLTPPTSNTDAGSISTATDMIAVPKAQGRKSERLQKTRSGISTYNENVLSGSARKTTRKIHEIGDGRIKCNDTLVNSDNEHKQSIIQNIQLLGSKLIHSGENLKGSSTEPNSAGARRSTRSAVIERANSIAKKARSILGKRDRETYEAGIDEIQSNEGAGKDFLESEHSRISPSERPLKKQTRSLDKSDSTFIAPTAQSEMNIKIRPKAKRWLGQGLYVGQDRHFDPRLTETKNKQRRLSDKRINTEHHALLPMPMFAGQRMLELGRNFKLPFDIFSPLPPGQPRPEEWKKTHKNIFIGDAASVWKKNKRLESSRCVCTPHGGCDENCFNRFMFYECDTSNCNIGADFCTNRSFESLRQRIKAGGKYNIGVEVIKTLDRGHGVRSNRTFEPNEIIVEYTGEIITQDECDDRMNKCYKNSECYYLMDFDQHMILDATRGSIARFINHSCEPNCKMIKWTVAGKPRMALFAGEQGIMTGEELTYDYNFNPYSVKNVQQCRCGALSCRGVLGPKPKEKEIKDALKPLTTGNKRKFQKTIEDAFKVVTKKRKIAIASSAMNAVTKASRKLSKSRILASSTSSNQRQRAVKKVITKSVTRTRIVRRAANQVRKNATAVYARGRSSARAVTKEKPPQDKRPQNKQEVPTAEAASSVKQNPMRTTKGRLGLSTRASVGRGSK